MPSVLNGVGGQIPATHGSRPLRSGSRVAPLLLPNVADRDFMPPALGLAETPPSPIRLALMLTICLVAASGLIWSWFGRVDVIATARGEIEPLGHVKIVQPSDGGKVSELNVAEGQSVREGDVLLRLDAREAEAGLVGARKVETAARAEAERRQGAVDSVRSGCVTCWVEPTWTSDIPAGMRQREDEVLRSDLAEIASTLTNLTDQQNEKTTAITQSLLNIQSHKQLLATLIERVDMRQLLTDRNVGSRAGVIDATQSLREAQTQLVAEQGHHALAVAALASLTSERKRVIDTFLAEQTRKMAEASRVAEEKQWERARAQTRVDHMVLRAPVGGTVQNLTITTPGQVVSAGQEVLRIVPSGGTLAIQAYVSNEDVGFVKPGQVASVKVDAFPFSRYGTLQARVSSISQDAVPAAAADEALVDQSRTNARSSQTMAPSARPMTNLLFATTLDLESRDFAVEGTSFHLRPGMTTSVEIKTGSRRIISYLLAPLIEVGSDALHER